MFPRDEIAADDQNTAEMGDPTAWKSSLARIHLSESLLLQEVPGAFEFAFEDHLHDARSLLSNDKISLLRYKLVPSEIDETRFWCAH